MDEHICEYKYFEKDNNLPSSKESTCSYVLITPARNEQDYIKNTIESVTSQTVFPKKWVIVSDGSTDRTDFIVEQYMERFSWIELIRMPQRRDRNFAAKVRCFNAGYERVSGLDYKIIGNLDADVSFEKDYFEFLMMKFSEYPTLGVAGTPFVEGSFQYNYKYTSIDHVSGACQLFRRECFEDIGGYNPIKGGGIDLVAVTTARMRGWKTRSFLEKTYIHHRKLGTGKSNALIARFRFGKQDFYLGSHPAWETFRCVYQMKKKPYIFGGILLFVGYFWAYLSKAERPVSDEFVIYRRREQMQRLKEISAQFIPSTLRK